MSELSEQQCIPCQGHESPVKGKALEDLIINLDNGWNVVEEHHLQKEFTFNNFREALDFTNRIGELAEEQGHHPDIYLAYGKVTVKMWTHKIDGLTESDFVFAAKIDALDSDK